MEVSMRMFVSVLEGETADDTHPILMTGDAAVLRAVADALSRRIGGDVKAAARVVKLVRDDRGDDDLS